MKKNRMLVVAATAGVLAVAGSLVAQPPGEYAKNAQTAFVLRGGIVQPLRLSGTAEAVIESTIASEQEGVVESMMVDDGDVVTTGTVLMTLRRDTIRFMMESAKASAKSEQAKLLELKTGSRPEDIQIARTTFEEAQVTFEVATRDFTRFTDLYASRSVSASELDQAKEALESARARLDSSKASYDLAKQGPRAEVIAAQEATAASSSAQAKMWADNYERAEIKAPYAGVVTARHVNVGSWVGVGDPALELATLDRIRVRAQVPEQEFNGVRVGSKAFVTFDSDPTKTYELPVTRVVARADTQNRSFPILIDVANPEGRFAPGMLARVEFKRMVDGKTTLIPKDALVAQGPVPVVMKVEYKDGVPHAKRLEVTIGRFFGEAVEVLTGDLNPGDQVVVRGNERLQDGDKLALNTFVTDPAPYVADESKFFKENPAK